MTSALVARLDSAGDVLVTGPAIRAVAGCHDRVVMLAGPRGRAAAELLPGIDEIVEWQAPWVDFDAPELTAAHAEDLIKRLRDTAPDRAYIFTSFHQSPLPLALLCRMAGVPWVGAISVDYPGSLLDLRHQVPDGIPEPLRALSLTEAAGCRLPDGDAGTLRITGPAPLPPWLADEVKM
ncbi:glycosyltransferase family 9 protein [Mycobacterium sp. NAZ190054]|uniref:glycosyltransferase family 9 protein n=1 Tax=Mycobacterium sp. NAZ190054 TaxID=1747766 RepID=UPI000B28DF5A